jgi:hypothetical protein
VGLDAPPLPSLDFPALTLISLILFNCFSKTQRTCLVVESAFAQAVEPPKSAEQIKEIEDRVSYWRTTCLESPIGDQETPRL